MPSIFITPKHGMKLKEDEDAVSLIKWHSLNRNGCLVCLKIHISHVTKLFTRSIVSFVKSYFCLGWAEFRRHTNKEVTIFGGICATSTTYNFFKTRCLSWGPYIKYVGWRLGGFSHGPWNFLRLYWESCIIFENYWEAAKKFLMFSFLLFLSNLI